MPPDADTEAPVSQNPALAALSRIVVAITLVVGTAVLAATLAAPRGSGLFFACGLAAAATWVAGAALAVPRGSWKRSLKPAGPLGVVVPLGLGVALFGAFAVAKLIADRVSLLSGSVASVLARAHAGPVALILVVALVNAVGEEVFFRGALHAALAGSPLGEKHATFWTTAVYCIVTLASLNAALVLAALVMGTIFSAERRATGGVLAPILTHASWSVLIILVLPR